jgi:hypothetical protein
LQFEFEVQPLELLQKVASHVVQAFVQLGAALPGDTHTYAVVPGDTTTDCVPTPYWL